MIYYFGLDKGRKYFSNKKEKGEKFFPFKEILIT
jgi:hypothetical protein